MINCPDEITIQALIDGECTDMVLQMHLVQCSSCQAVREELEEAINLADGLNGGENLPGGFYERLEKKLNPPSWPAFAVAAAAFILIVLSAYYLNPGYLQWWFSVGITRLFSLVLDAFIEILKLSRAAGQPAIISLFALLVALEIFLLNLLKNVEGTENA